jgi:hypothetical protein
LRDWWKRTIEGPVDEDYWAWQAYVGLIHVKRGWKGMREVSRVRW